MAEQQTGAHRLGAGGRSTGGAWAVVALLLGIGIVVPLLVFLYDSEKPTLWGFPFYYWFQFALIPVVSALTFTAFRISQAATRQDRARLGLRGGPVDEEGVRR
jgi:CBS domain containing-hemolysin-like protein